MNAQSDLNDQELRNRQNLATAWIIGSVSFALWMAFTPYVALEQARQLALCLTTLCGVYIFSMGDRVRKKIALTKELHWHGFNGSAA